MFSIRKALSQPAKPCFIFKTPFCTPAKPCFNFKTHFRKPRHPFSKPFGPIAALHWPFSKPIRHTRDGDLVEMLSLYCYISFFSLFISSKVFLAALEPSKTGNCVVNSSQVKVCSSIIISIDIRLIIRSSTYSRFSGER